MTNLINSIKKRTYLIGILLLTMTFGCGGDDDNIEGLSDGNPASLVGKWICTQIEIDEEGDVDIITPKGNNYYLQLNENGSAKVQPANLFEDEKRGNVTWKVSGKKLLFSDNSEYTIKQLSSDHLVLEWIDEWEDGGYLRETHTFKKEIKEDSNSGK